MFRLSNRLRSSHHSPFHSNFLIQSFTISGPCIKQHTFVCNRLKRTLLINPESRHDRVLTASLGLVSGGIIVTSAVIDQDNCTHLKAAINHQYGDGNDLFYHDRRQPLNISWFEDTNKKCIATLIAANTLIFGLWRVSFRNAKLHQFMWRHFASSYDAVIHGKRFHTLLTSAFSHITFPHFGINMFMLWEFGPHVLAPSNNHSGSWYNQAVTNSRFAGYVRDNFSSFRHQPKLLSIKEFTTLYFTSALTSSALSALMSKLRGNGSVFSIGASGAVSAVFTMSCLLFPDQRLLLYGIIEMTSTQMLQLYTAFNIVGASFQRNLRVDCVGHLGGQGTGLVFHQAQSSN